MTNSEQRVDARQIRQLEQKPESDRREFISVGLAKIAENMRILLDELLCIEDTAVRASRILSQIAGEEAAKGFILVDYMRPYSGISQNQRSEHLKCFYDHLARGIYVEYYNKQPDGFAEVEDIIKDCRASHYLDGPNDVDWIFRNRIESEREGELYVDLISDEEGLRWQTPSDLLGSGFIWPGTEPKICRLFLIMQELGLFSKKALSIMTEIWKNEDISSMKHWFDYMPVNKAFLSECAKKDLLSSSASSGLLDKISWDFLYPLCELELKRLSVPFEELQQQRERHLRFLNRG